MCRANSLPSYSPQGEVRVLDGITIEVRRAMPADLVERL
jgi:hypothetical protein